MQSHQNQSYNCYYLYFQNYHWSWFTSPVMLVANSWRSPMLRNIINRSVETVTSSLVSTVSRTSSVTSTRSTMRVCLKPRDTARREDLAGIQLRARCVHFSVIWLYLIFTNCRDTKERRNRMPGSTIWGRSWRKLRTWTRMWRISSTPFSIMKIFPGRKLNLQTLSRTSWGTEHQLTALTRLGNCSVRHWHHRHHLQQQQPQQQ